MDLRDRRRPLPHLSAARGRLRLPGRGDASRRTSSAPCTCTATSPIAGDGITPGSRSARCGAPTIQSGAAAPRMSSFRVGRCGRFEWETDGEPTYVQFLPPHMADLSAPAEVIVASMDYAGIATSILQNDHIYGNLAEDFAAAGKAHTRAGSSGSRRSTRRTRTRTSSLPSCATRSNDSGMAGLYFTTAGLSLSGYRPLHDDPTYDPLWAGSRAPRSAGLLGAVRRIAGRHLRGRDALPRADRRAPSEPAPCARAWAADRALCRRRRPGRTS